MPKAELALEYIVRLMIVLVVLVVVIGMTIEFKNEIITTVKKFFGEKNPQINFPQLITKNTFNPGEISAYIEKCYFTLTALPENKQEDIVCYLLEATDGFAIEKTDLEKTISKDIKDKVNITATFKKSIIKIQYQDIENIILVSD